MVERLILRDRVRDVALQVPHDLRVHGPAQVLHAGEHVNHVLRGGPQRAVRPEVLIEERGELVRRPCPAAAQVGDVARVDVDLSGKLAHPGTALVHQPCQLPAEVAHAAYPIRSAIGPVHAAHHGKHLLPRGSAVALPGDFAVGCGLSAGWRSLPPGGRGSLSGFGCRGHSRGETMGTRAARDADGTWDESPSSILAPGPWPLRGASCCLEHDGHHSRREAR